MPHGHVTQYLLDEVRSITSNQARCAFDLKFLSQIPDLSKDLSGEDIALIAIELNYRWSHAQHQTISGIDSVSSMVSARQMQLDVLQQLNMAFFAELEDSLSIRALMVNQFCREGINTDNFGPHTQSALRMYKELRQSDNISISDRWSVLKTWQQVILVMAVITLSALTILAALTGIGLIAEAFGATIVASATLAWMGLPPLGLGIFGGITLASAAVTATVATTTVISPHRIFQPAIQPVEDEAIMVSRASMTTEYY